MYLCIRICAFASASALAPVAQSFHIYSFSLRFHCGSDFGFGSHSFLIKCINQKARLPSNVGHKNHFCQPAKYSKAAQKGHSFIFHVPFIFPSSGDKLMGGNAPRHNHYELFLIALNLLSVKMRQISTKIEAICGKKATRKTEQKIKQLSRKNARKKKNALVVGDVD